MKPPRRTLLCILDWGLGHAARSLALLDHALLKDDEVHLASSGPARQFLLRERPDLTVHSLPAYGVRYPTGSMPLNVALQLPRWWRAARRERRATAELARRLCIDRIVSDGRFGCRVEGVPSIFLTHQLHPITNSAVASWLYRRYLLRFDSFWVPDDAEQSLSGTLSRSEGYREVRYVGPLSRLQPAVGTNEKLDVLAILSGPEPMRSELEGLLLDALQSVPGQHCLVRGTPDQSGERSQGNTRVVGLAGGAQLSKLIGVARWVVCRSGYSTLMDLAAVGATANRIYIPTPGQTEQAYLARTQVAAAGGRSHVLYQSDVTPLRLSKIVETVHGENRT